MLKSDCKVGDFVIFGNRNGQQTLGRIIKLNPMKAKVRQEEARGRSKAHAIGTTWVVRYAGLLRATEAEKARAEKSPLQGTHAGAVQDGMIGQIQKNASKRFSTKKVDGDPNMLITDNETGRQVEVPIFAAGETLKAMSEMFPASVPV